MLVLGVDGLCIVCSEFVRWVMIVVVAFECALGGVSGERERSRIRLRDVPFESLNPHGMPPGLAHAVSRRR